MSGNVVARLSYKRDIRRPGEALMPSILTLAAAEYEACKAPVDAVPVDDGRAPQRAGQLSLSASGFALAEHGVPPGALPAAGPGGADPPDAYLTSVEECVARHTGAAACVAVGFTLRDAGAAPAAVRRGSVRPVAGAYGVERNPHNDFTERDTARLAAYLTPGSPGHGLGHLQTVTDPTKGRVQRRIAALHAAGLDPARCRLMVVNLWRPLGPYPVRRDPLAVCDSRTVRMADLLPTHVPVSMGQPLQGGCAYYQASYSPAHRWYYFPEMQHGEVILLKTFDSLTAAWPLPLHTAFDHPGTRAADPPRRSCETRVVCLLPDGATPAVPPSVAPAPAAAAAGATPLPRL